MDSSIYFPPNRRRQAIELLLGVVCFVIGAYTLLAFSVPSQYITTPPTLSRGGVYIVTATPSSPNEEAGFTSLSAILAAVAFLIASITLFSVGWARSQGPIPWSVAMQTRGAPFLALAATIQRIFGRPRKY